MSSSACSSCSCLPCLPPAAATLPAQKHFAALPWLRSHSPGHAAGGAFLANLIAVSHCHVSGGAVDALLVARSAVGQAIDRGELVDGADTAVGGTCRRVVARGAAERGRGGLVSFHHLCSKHVCKCRLELLNSRQLACSAAQPGSGAHQGTQALSRVTLRAKPASQGWQLLETGSYSWPAGSTGGD